MTKRYLITKNDLYYNNLSDASKKTFEYQGGKLSTTELFNFENGELFNLHLQIREWDDMAKSTDEKLLYRIETMDAPKYYHKLY